MVAYWLLVDLAAVYSRRINGITLTLAPTGWTYKNSFVLYDKESGTLWYPDRKGLKGIQGKYFGRFLPKLPSYDTRWGDWINSYHNTKILK